MGKLLLVLGLVFSMVLIGCGAEKAKSPQEAIEIAKGMKTTQEKVEYLIQQAEAFYNSKEFNQAMHLTKTILTYLDKNSQEAKNLLVKANKALAKNISK